MNEWLKKNSWGLVIAGVTMASTFALYGYRLDAVEAQQDRQGTAITNIQDKSNDLNVALARIQTDIEYIKIQVGKIVQ